MSRKFLVPIDLNNNELQNAVVQNLSSAPNSGNKEGRIYYDSNTHKLRYYGANGAWYDLAAGGTAASTVTLTGDVTGTASVNPATGVITLSTTVAHDYVDSINGTANQIVVSGSGGAHSTPTLSLADDVKINSSLNVANGKFTINSNGNAYVAGTLEVAGATTLDSSLEVAGATTLDSSLEVTGNATFNNTLTSNGLLQVNNAANITGDVVVGGTLTIDGNLELSGIEFVSNYGNSIKEQGTDLVITAGNGNIVLNPDGSLVVNSDMSAYAVHTQTVVNNNGTLNVQSNTSVDISAPAVNITGPLTVNSNTEFKQNVVIDGDLEVKGTLNAINKQTLDVADNQITLNSNWTGAPTQDAAIIVNRGTANDVSLLWSESNDQWQLTNDGTNYHAVARKFVALIGDDSNTSFSIQHNLGTRDVTVQIFENNEDYNQVEADVKVDKNNMNTTVIVSFSEAPSTNSYRVVVVG